VSKGASKGASSGALAGAASGASTASRVLLLGPLSDGSVLPEVVADLGSNDSGDAGGRVAAITAGWREREAEPEILGAGLADRVEDLALYRRAELVVETDPEFGAAHKKLQVRLKVLRRAYNVRLHEHIDGHRRLLALEGDETVLDDERAAALESIRQLDARHLDRVAELRAAFVEEFRPVEREAVVAQRKELRQVLDGHSIILIAGGHVAALLNRLRLFGFADLVEDRTLVAWSAGAMALAPTVVLFHDRPPWGAGNAEAFDRGLGLIADVVPLPHASARLNLDDRERTARLAKRFAPHACVLFDPGTRIEWSGGRWTAPKATRRLDHAGRLMRFSATAA